MGGDTERVVAGVGFGMSMAETGDMLGEGVTVREERESGGAVTSPQRERERERVALVDGERRLMMMEIGAERGRKCVATGFGLVVWRW